MNKQRTNSLMRVFLLKYRAVVPLPPTFIKEIAIQIEKEIIMARAYGNERTASATIRLTQQERAVI